ncbi:radical SAM/SPASM domain-containing protein [Pseudomonadota bacterium]
MSYQQLLQKCLGNNVLYTAMFELTYRCNLDCFFCYNDRGLQGKLLSLQDYIRVFDDLIALGTMNITLTGGEPLAHPQFFDIGVAARQRGFTIKIKSNGHALRGGLLGRIKEELDPLLIETSLHGACAESHDKQTRVPGSFDRLLENLKQVRSMGIRIQVNSSLTRWNEGEIEKMYALTDEMGLAHNFSPEVTPRDDGDKTPLDIAPSEASVFKLLDIQAKRARNQRLERADVVPTFTGEDKIKGVKDSGKQCGAGSVGIAVDPIGNVYPCIQWRRSMGNLHQQSIKEIWTESAMVKEIRDLTIQAKSKNRKYGEPGKRMAYCAAMAEITTGDPLRIYPLAKLRLAHGQKLAESGSLP